MTTNETTARDRAIEVTTSRWWGEIGPLEARVLAARAVDELLANPDVLRALAEQAGATATEWGARWFDGGYCPSVPPRSEEFACQHAGMFGTRPIRRVVGPWVYADTGEPVFPADEPEEGTR